MSTAYEVWLDEERQIIRQRVHVEPDLAMFRAMVAETTACVQQLRQPTEVRILADGEWGGRMSQAVRAESARTLHRPELKKLAVVTRRSIQRVIIRFIRVATGSKKINAFADEAAALVWLLS
jgi:hypothetical protein